MYHDKMKQLGYDQLICDIFSEWEDVKDEILIKERKEGTGSGTVHVFLGAADSILRQEFSSYYDAVNNGEDPSNRAVPVRHYFLTNNVLSMIGYLCQYHISQNTDFTKEVKSIIVELLNATDNRGLVSTTSLFKLSTGSNKLRPYFKQFDEKGAFYRIIRHLLLPQSAYKISLYKNDKGEYAAFWLIGFDYMSNFEADSSKEHFKQESVIGSLQQIFYGAPGTGKSHEIKKQTIGEQVIRTTFHPDSDYSTFVGAYKPTTKQVPMRDVTGKVIQENKEDVTEDRIIYEFVEQAFLQAYTQAWRLYANADDEQPKKQFLVIEEINRGNCAQIFGDLFQLLDRNDAGFSEYPIKADKDIRKQLAKAFAGITITDKSTINQWFDGKDVAGEVLSGEVLLLPSNLFIWATMNTSDQSLFPIDSAFKRRWDWQYIPISNANKGWKIKVNGKQYDWWDFLEKMNEQINATTNSEDKKMGYFFCKAKDGIIDAKTFVGKVVFYVWNDVFKDFANEAGGIFKDEDGSLLSFNKFYHVVHGKTEVLEDKVELLLNNLGVVAEGETIDVEELEKNASANSSKNYLKEIVFPDGTIYSTSEMTHFDAYMAAIRKIGIERVASVADKLKYRRLNRPLISAEKYEEIENSAGFSYYQEGSYFFVKGVMTYTLVRILEDLNEMLNVGMTINN